MSEFRILDANFCFDPATAFRPTSEDSAFPADNLAHPFRSKSWRSYGFFRIQSTNCKLNFKDSSGGSELTATIPTGEYSVSELETMIAARMVLAGGSGDYTVTFSRTTGRWTIATSGSDLRLLASSGTDIANGIWSTIGFAVYDYVGAATHTGAYVAIHTEERLVIDTGNEDDVDSFAMVFDPDLGHRFSESATIKLLASNTNYWYGSPAVDVTLTADDTYGCITHFFSSAQNYRYWCVKIVDPQNPYLYVEIPKIILCEATQLSQAPQLGFAETVQDQSKQQENDYGHVYSDINPTRRRFRFSYENLSATDLQTLQTICKRLGGVTPIGVALDSSATLFDKDRFFLYGRLRRENEAGHVFYQYFNTGLVVEEAF